MLQSDGTEVDDDEYFQTLPVNTVLTALQPGEDWQPDATSAVSSVVSALNRRRDSLARLNLRGHVQDLLSRDVTTPNELSFLLEVNKLVESNSEAETRDDDVTWFEGVERRFRTKDDVMRDGARRRVRSYLNSARDYVKQRTPEDRDVASVMTSLLDVYKCRLADNDFYSVYFSRRHNGDKSQLKKGQGYNSKHLQAPFCDTSGWFSCEGDFSASACDAKHVINPFASRASRIVFSTWNLDHRVEKSREVLPSLWSAILNLNDDVTRSKRLRLNEDYFYELLFTRINLRLVHIVCHDKKGHAGFVCDSKKFYIK